MWAAGLSIDPMQAGNAKYFVLLALVMAIRFAFTRSAFRWSNEAADCAEYYALFTVMALTGAVCTYPISAMTHDFADDMLQRIDLALHFDWLAWYGMVSRHGSLQLLGGFAYDCIYLIPAILLAGFAVQGNRREAHRFLAAFWLAAIVTLILFRFMPAAGPLAYLWKGPIPYMPTTGLWQPDLIPALRAHQVGLVNLSELRGLVSAPSFHAASGTLYIAAARHCGRARWPVIGLSLAMLLSTPVEGTHYLSDMILGACVALAAWCAASILMDKVVAARPGNGLN
jgi:membrane-associated phospholipid phosphatase